MSGLNGELGTVQSHPRMDLRFVWGVTHIRTNVYIGKMPKFQPTNIEFSIKKELQLSQLQVQEASNDALTCSTFFLPFDKKRLNPL